MKNVKNFEKAYSFLNPCRRWQGIHLSCGIYFGMIMNLLLDVSTRDLSVPIPDVAKGLSISRSEKAILRGIHAPQRDQRP